jgi:hypothetical protein
VGAPCFPSAILKDTMTLNDIATSNDIVTSNEIRPMASHRTRAGTVVRLLLATALLMAGNTLIGASPAAAWCSPNPTGSGLKSWGEETYRGATCDRDWYYAGQVRDSPTVADGYCAHIRLNSGGGWFTQAYACSSTWVSYQVINAPAYATKLCQGATSICSLGSYVGA